MPQPEVSKNRTTLNCRGTPYDVVRASDHRKLVDVAIGTYQREVRSSEAVVRCVRNKSFWATPSRRHQRRQRRRDRPRAGRPGGDAGVD